MTYKRPEIENLSREQPRQIASDDRAVAFELWHPQWGGYGAPCVVEFDKITGDGDGGPGCFYVTVWHDGEFPREEALGFHYCAAEQVVDFGLSVLELQMAHEKTNGGHPIRIREGWLAKLKERVDALVRAQPDPEPTARD